MRAACLALFVLACRPVVPSQPAAKQVPAQFTAPADARAWYLKAVAAELHGDLDEANRALEWVTRLDRRSPWPYIARGRLEERKGNPTGAMAAYDQAIGLAPVAEAHLARGRLRLKSGDLAGALADLEQPGVRELDEGRAVLVRALMAAGRSAEALELLVDWAPAHGAHQTLRAELLGDLDPGSAVDAWLVLVEVDSPALQDVAALVAAASASCRAGVVAAWLAERSVASWGPAWAALVGEVEDDQPGCATDSK